MGSCCVLRCCVLRCCDGICEGTAREALFRHLREARGRRSSAGSRDSHASRCTTRGCVIEAGRRVQHNEVRTHRGTTTKMAQSRERHNNAGAPLEHIAMLSCFHASRGPVRAAARGKPTLERSACGRAYCRPMQPLHLASSRGWSRLQASGFSRSETAQTQRGCSLHEPPQALPVWCCSLLSAHSHAPPAIALSFHIPAAGCHSSRGQRPSSSWQGEAVLGTQVRLGASGPALRVAADSPSSRHVTSTSRTQSGVLARMTSTPAPRST
jgi:hypothetical protein